ncbi:hypothetical protein POVWA2_069620 [Plasmodium ovale wallikeri]|uniref:STP1 protein n=1 Tax=Plasmodium ovale wallikeri TaxID=864142 RepID=A0A1A9AHV9_PLAOA|nr:hypothetical protein POVWA2_069620 [Plasmodium ovale wallikeri]
MKSYTHTCNRINAASQRDTNNIFLPYRTPILQGAISIIKDFEKNKDDGVDYLNLCDELNKYVNIQKECINPSLKSKNMRLFNIEWKKTITGIQTTFRKRKINRLCYWEGDKKKSDKEHVLGIYDEFRKFCIEKKQKETKYNLNFEECMLYLQWVNTKKELFKALDPGYTNIEAYKDYFNIRDKCNYPWLVSNIPDVTCTQLTRTRGAKKDDPGKTSGDTHQITPGVTQVNNPNEKKDTPPAVQRPGKAAKGPVKVKTSNIGPEKAPAHSTPSGDDNVNNVQQNYDVKLQGTPIDESNPDTKSPLDKQSSPAYIDPKVLDFIKHIQDSFHGHIITHDTRQSINRRPDAIYEYNPSYVHGEKITPPITKPNNFIPLNVLYSQRFAQLLRSQRFVELLRLQPFRHLLFSKQFLSYFLSKEPYIQLLGRL